MHAQVVAANPGLKFGDIAKLLGQKWKALSDAEKAPYKAKETQAAPRPAPRRPRSPPPSPPAACCMATRGDPRAVGR